MMMTFATRDDLRHLGRTMQNDFNISMKNLEVKMQDNFNDAIKELKMDMLGNFDSVMRELERIREDRIFAKGKDNEPGLFML